MTDKKPTSFNQLGVAELRRSAVEDFAVPLDGDKPNKEQVLAALEESGVTWADYVAQHPDVAPDEPEVSPSGKQEHLTVPNNTGNSDGPHLRFNSEGGNIIVAEEPVYKAEDKYLIKMVRENLVYEAAGLRFTQEHPYALANAAQADHILEKEDGFRQATPGELREYYS